MHAQKPQAGTVKDNSYLNRFFGISCSFPSSWTVQATSEDPSADQSFQLFTAEKTGSNSSTTILLSAKPMRDSHHRANQTQDDDFDALVADFGEKGWKRVGNVGQRLITGALFYRQDLALGDDADAHVRSLLAAASRGYMLQLLVSANSQTELNSALEIADVLVIKPDWSSPNDVSTSPAIPPVRVSQGVLHAFQIKSAQPRFPMETILKGTNAEIVIRMLVGKDGRVRRLYVVEGNRTLQDAAIQAIRQWQYKPYLLNGVPVEVESTVWFTVFR